MKRLLRWLLARPVPPGGDPTIGRAFNAGWDAAFGEDDAAERPVTAAALAAWHDGHRRGRIAADVW